jgi:hypothetical protein
MVEDELTEVCEMCGCAITIDDADRCADCARPLRDYDKAAALVGLDGWLPKAEDSTID